MSFLLKRHAKRKQIVILFCLTMCRNISTICDILVYITDHDIEQSIDRWLARYNHIGNKIDMLISVIVGTSNTCLFCCYMFLFFYILFVLIVIEVETMTTKYLCLLVLGQLHFKLVKSKSCQTHHLICKIHSSLFVL